MWFRRFPAGDLPKGYDGDGDSDSDSDGDGDGVGDGDGDGKIRPSVLSESSNRGLDEFRPEPSLMARMSILHDVRLTCISPAILTAGRDRI